MKKKILSLLLAISMIAILIAIFPVSTSATTTSWDGHVANGFESGEGTETDPYIIKTGSQLAYLAETVNSGIAYEGEYFKLANDIILNTSDMFVYDERGYVTGVKNEKALNEWTAIGNYISSTSYNAFSGVFDGNNYEIKGLYINKPTINCQGVFGYCKNAMIKNVGVTDGYVIGNDCVGGIIGQSDNSLSIENCRNSCAVRGEDTWASIGGLIGYYVHTDCGTSIVSVKNCYNVGNVSGVVSDDNRVGGLIGYVIEEYNAGMIEIINCYNAGVVSTGLSNYGCGGGVIGETAALYGSIKSIGCYNSGEINSGKSAGIIGRIYTNTAASQIVENCYNLGVVIGNTYAGGVVGTNDPGGTSTIKNCYNIGMVQGNTSQVVGGIVGWNVAWNGLATITNCYNIGMISGTGDNVGGIAGQNTAAQGLSYTGTATIENCYNSGVISGDYNAFGGIVGKNNPYSGTGKVKVTNCYNTGAIGTGLDATVGGIAGVASAHETKTSSIITNCYNVGKLNGVGQYVGGIVGCRNGTSGTWEVSNCYYLDACIEEENEYGILLNDEQMRQQRSFSGYNFSTKWTMEGKTDYPYPELVGLSHNGPPITPIYSTPEALDGAFNFASGTGWAEYYYKDSYFEGISQNYNHELSKMSVRLALSAFASNNGSVKYQNAEKLLTDLNFNNIDYNYAYTVEPDTDSIGIIVGKKHIAYTDDDYTLLAVAIRGGGYKDEWYGNFRVGNENIHEGFNLAKGQVVDFLTNYVKEKEITGKVKIWITGYSRAGATANLTAAYLNENPNCLSDLVTLTTDNIYAYCFEPPAGVKNPDNQSGLYNNIFNIVNQHDFVPMVAMKKWGFDRYGITKYLPSAYTNKDYITLKSNMSTKFKEYAGENYAVDNFTYYTIYSDKNAVINKGTYNQGVYLERIIDKLADNIGSTKNYENEFQTVFCEYIGQDILGSGNIQPLCDSLKQELTDSTLIALLSDSFLALNPSFTWIGQQTAYWTLRKAVKDAFENVGTEISNYAVDTIVKLILDIGVEGVYNLLENANGIKQSHYPELCMAWLDTIDENDFTNKRLRTLYLNCPVDLEIYDSKNDLVAAIYDDVPQSIDGSSIFPFIDENGQKVVYLPQDEEYRIEVIATDDGEVTYTVQEEDLSTNSVKVINYNNMIVSKSDILTGTAENLTTTDAVYSLLSNTAEVKEAEIIENAEPISVTTSVEGNGYTFGDNMFYKGEYAQITATPTDSEEFIGWFNGEILVSEDMSYRFQVTDPVILTAKFTENTCEVIFVDEEDNIVAKQRIKKGNTIIMPQAPLKEGYILEGFYKDEEYTIKVDADDVYDADTTNYVKYSKLKTEDGIWYAVNDEVVKVLGYEGEETSIIIPTSISEYPVKKIANHAFAGKNIETILIPASITEIGEDVFENCEFLAEILYMGSEEQWQKIDIAEENTVLNGMNTRFNCFTEFVFAEISDINYQDGTLVLDITFNNAKIDFVLHILTDDRAGVNKYELAKEEVEKCTESVELSIPFIPDDKSHNLYIQYEIDEDVYEYEENIKSFYAEKTLVGTEYDEIFYVLLDDERAEVTGASTLYLEIPPIVDGHKVVSIAENAFYNSDVRSVLLPITLENIGKNAFYNCSDLESINYAGSSEKWQEVAIEEGNTIISESIKYDFPDSIWMDWGWYQFNVDKWEIPLTFYRMYKECSLLVQIYEYDINTDSLAGKIYEEYHDIPLGITDYQVSIPFPADNKRYSIVPTLVDKNDHGVILMEYNGNGFLTAEREVFQEDGWRYYCYDGISEIAGYDGEIAEILTIPAELGGCPVTKIEEWALYISPEMAPNLEKLVIPSTVTHIGREAFGMMPIKEAVIPASVCEFGQSPFVGCNNLTNIIVDEANDYYTSIDGNLYTKDKKKLVQYALGNCSSEIVISEGTEIIGEGVFAMNEKIEKVKLPSSINELEPYAFTYCSNLKDIEVDNTSNITKIGRGAFQGTAFEKFEIPASVTFIGEGAFDSCDNLTSIEVESDNNVYCSVNGNLYSKDKKTFILYANGKQDTYFEIPDTITEIVDGAFNSASIERIFIPKSVMEIGVNAFGYNMQGGIICYEGSQEEWNDFIDYDNASMFVYNSEKIFDFNKTATVKGNLLECYYDNGYVTAHVKMDYVFEDCAAILAVYDKDERLVSMTSAGLSKELQNIDIPCKVNEDCEDYTAKVFFWKNFASIKPLAEPIIVNISEPKLELVSPYEEGVIYEFYQYNEKCESISLTFSEDTVIGDSNVMEIFGLNDEFVGQYYSGDLSGQTITVPGNKVKIAFWAGQDDGNGYKVTNIVINK